MRRAGQEGVVLISVILAGAVLSLVMVGLLDAVSDDLRLIRFHKDYLLARYAADAGAAVMLAYVAENRIDEITTSDRVMPVGGGNVKFHRMTTESDDVHFASIGRVGRGVVTVRLAVERKPPHRVRIWTVEP